MNEIASESSKKMAENDSTISIEKRVSNLTNSTHFFLQKAIIIELEKGSSYRLVVIKAGVIKTDKIYRTPDGAKLAFWKLHCNNDEQKKSDSPIWTQFYEIDNEWLAHWTQPEKQEKD